MKKHSLFLSMTAVLFIALFTPDNAFCAKLFRGLTSGLKGLLLQPEEGEEVEEVSLPDALARDGNLLQDEQDDAESNLPKKQLVWGTCALQGDGYKEMYDDHFPHDEEVSRVHEQFEMFGVYGGHGGHSAAGFAAQNLHKFITRSWQETYSLFQVTASLSNIIKRSFLQLSREYYDQHAASAVVAIIKNHNLLIAHVGNCRAVVSSARIARRLSFDHLPWYQGEYQRILGLGGNIVKVEGSMTPLCIHVEQDGNPIIETSMRMIYRVNGGLTISRAIGAHDHQERFDKTDEPCIIAEPSINNIHLNRDHKFVILASSGLWNVLSDQAAVDFVHSFMSERGINGESISREQAFEVAKALVEFAFTIYNTESITATIIFFKE